MRPEKITSHAGQDSDVAKGYLEGIGGWLVRKR